MDRNLEKELRLTQAKERVARVKLNHQFKVTDSLEIELSELKKQMESVGDLKELSSLNRKLAQKERQNELLMSQINEIETAYMEISDEGARQVDAYAQKLSQAEGTIVSLEAALEETCSENQLLQAELEALRKQNETLKAALSPAPASSVA